MEQYRLLQILLIRSVPGRFSLQPLSLISMENIKMEIYIYIYIYIVPWKNVSGKMHGQDRAEIGLVLNE